MPEKWLSFTSRLRAVGTLMKVHRRSTYQSGADAMLVSRSWHSSVPLDKVQIGDILRVKNKDTLEAVDWKVTESPVALSDPEAREEWLKLRFFSDSRRAQRYRYFPYLLRNLEKVREYPPEKPSARYIPSEVRIRVWIRDEGRCKSCGATENLQFDHIIPVSKGGSNGEENIELLCSACNQRKASRIV
jgi:hypothetical protein